LWARSIFQVVGREVLRQSKAGRPELFSMWLCFAGDREFRKAHFEDFDKAKWLQAAKKLKSKTGVNPHPVARASVAQLVKISNVKCGLSLA